MTDIIIQKKNEVFLTLEAEQHILHELSDYFSFTLDNAKFYRGKRYKYWNGQIKLLNMRDNSIYCGLLYRLTDWADKHNYSWAFKDNKFYGLPHEEDELVTQTGVELFMKSILKGISPREYQIKAVFEALRYNRKTIVSPTSSGKSAIIYSITRYHTSNKRRVLIIVPSTQLVEQMYKDFWEYGWDVDSNVHRIYSGYEHYTDKSVVISTWQSLQNHHSKWFEPFDTVIVDECHSAKATALKKIMEQCKDSKYRYGLTGTLTNGDNSSTCNKLVIEGLFGPVYQVIKTKELMDAGYVAKLNTHVITLLHKRNRFNSYNEEIEFLCQSEPRNKFLSKLTTTLKGNNLILFSRVEQHGIPLFNMIKEMTDRPVYLIYGGVDVEDREKVREITERSDNAIIVASYGTMSTGISIKRLNNIVFASPSKSRIRVLQSIGRVLRKAMDKDKATLYDISDDFQTNNYTLKHLEERIKFYISEDFNYDIHNINLHYDK